MQEQGLSEEELNSIYNWVDEVPLSRPKKNIARDFSDGVLTAEIIAHFLPQQLELHNYISANKKVLKKIGCQLTKQYIDNIVNCVPGSIERFLLKLKNQMGDIIQQNPQVQNPKKESDTQVINKLKQQQNYQVQSQEIMQEKDQKIQELVETVEILELKVKKLEELIKLKDNKIQSLAQKMQENGLL